MEAETRDRQLIMSERIYTATRVLLVGAAWILIAAAMAEPVAEILNAYTLAGAGVATLVTFVLIAAAQVRAVSYSDMLVWTIPFDLLSMGLLTIGLHSLEDPVYPALLAFPVFYSYVVRRREAWMISAASAIVYLVSHIIAHPPYDWVGYMVIAIKGGAIVYLGTVAAVAAARHAERQEEIERSNAEKEELAEQLTRRLSELQAVSQISEVIHSSLDFDRVGPLLLQILQKVIDVPSCCLLVVDKQKAETVFSASAGMATRGTPPALRADRLIDDPSSLHFGDAHFSCISILDHKHMMVVFCTEEDRIEQLTIEDKIVLQAVSSELAVAVENSQLYKLTRRLAITDELTGLHNYRHLQQRLDEEIERARRYRKDVSLIMIDADDFKRFNDSYGHIAGDHALAELGEVMRASVREVDMVARYGGEEFAVVLPETDAAGAFVVAEKIREAVSGHVFADADGERVSSLTVSLGLATFPAHADGKEPLLRQADDALYQAKNGGKNRVRSPRPRRMGADESTKSG